VDLVLKDCITQTDALIIQNVSTVWITSDSFNNQMWNLHVWRQGTVQHIKGRHGIVQTQVGMSATDTKHTKHTG
jgi:hypothetical protein